VACTQVRGVPHRVDDGPDTIFEDGSKWSAPLFTCASAVKASIKTVTFTHNGTADVLDNLRVMNIIDKEYADDDEVPLWGLEAWDYPLLGTRPVWGLVDRVYEGFPKVTTLRDPDFYLIGTANAADPLIDKLSPQYSHINLAGAIAPLAALATITTPRTSTIEPEMVNFAAAQNMGLWLRWRDLTASADSLPKMFRLMWTDLAASAMTGSKGVLGTHNIDTGNAARIQVRHSVHRIKYHILFAVPAFAVVLVMLIILALVLISLFAGHSSLNVMDTRLKQTSMGRVLTTLFYPETSSFDMPSKQWTLANANRPLDMSYSSPMPGDNETNPPPQAAASDEVRADKMTPLMNEMRLEGSDAASDGIHR
jgi:hypothetical protein